MTQKQDDSLRSRSLAALEQLESTEDVPFKRTTHPGAQWFADAAFGLFMHWGIHSVAGVQPSWAMMKGYPAGGVDDESVHGESYYRLTQEFDPQNYDPDSWIKAAKEAGMTYAVLTSRHHDGYALWPSEYGNLSTKQYMNGRDLLGPYVDACRKYGLKTGFYYSCPDWYYTGEYKDIIFGKPNTAPPVDEEGYYDYVTGQLSELLTRYGAIDIMWFDGGNIHTDRTLAWIRKLQPHIVINDRYNGVGDYETPECHTPEEAPDGWWEECNIWVGHWGYDPNASFSQMTTTMEKLVKVRSWGGNLLINVGPCPDGTMRPGYYKRMGQVAGWMAHSRKSIIGAEGIRNWHEFSNMPLTRDTDAWYVHVLPSVTRGGQKPELRDVPQPKAARLLRTNAPVEYTYEGGKVTLRIPEETREYWDDVVAIEWTEEPG